MKKDTITIQKIGKIVFILFLVLEFSVGCSQKTEEAVEPAQLTCEGVAYPDWKTSDYVLPYPVGKGYFVSLGHCSSFFHSSGGPDQYALDFAMSVGTLITASRSGKVVYVEESGTDGRFPNNLVVVEHEDGSFLQYMHLTNQGGIPEVGTIVVQGDSIGYSGNTGSAGFPHLHLVATSKGSFRYPYTSFPITFRNTEENEKSLLAGKRYEAHDYKTDE